MPPLIPTKERIFINISPNNYKGVYIHTYIYIYAYNYKYKYMYMQIYAYQD